MKRTNAVGDPQMSRNRTANTPQLLTGVEVARYEKQGVVEVQESREGLPLALVVVLLPVLVVVWLAGQIADILMSRDRTAKTRARQDRRDRYYNTTRQTRHAGQTVVNNFYINQNQI